MASEPKIYTGDEARALREAATPGPWDLSRDGDGIIDGIISLDPSEADADWPVLGAYEHDATPLLAVSELDMRAMAAAPDLLASVEHHAARADRLARILAVERGDWRNVPVGWEPRGADMWVRGTRPGRPVIQRWHRDGQPTEWLRRGQIDGPRWPTALEAMEAIDAEVSDG